MQGLRRLCSKYGTLLIMDEVACGFGRTAKMFATEHFKIEPDILCMAKALSSGHAPIGAAITTKRIMEEISDEWEFYSTFGWHPVAVEAAIATIKYFKRHSSLMKHVNELGDYFYERLSKMSFQHNASLRIKGAAIGVELQDDEYVSRLGQLCEEQGLLVSPQDNYLTMWPALTLDFRTAKRGLDILESCVSRVDARRKSQRAA